MARYLPPQPPVSPRHARDGPWGTPQDVLSRVPDSSHVSVCSRGPFLLQRGRATAPSRSPAGRHLAHFHFGAIMTRAVINAPGQVSVSTSSHSSKVNTRIGTAGPLRGHQTTVGLACASFRHHVLASTGHAVPICCSRGSSALLDPLC